MICPHRMSLNLCIRPSKPKSIFIYIWWNSPENYRQSAGHPIWLWIHTVKYPFIGMDIHAPTILMLREGTGFCPIPISIHATQQKWSIAIMPVINLHVIPMTLPFLVMKSQVYTGFLHWAIQDPQNQRFQYWMIWVFSYFKKPHWLWWFGYTYIYFFGNPHKNS